MLNFFRRTPKPTTFEQEHLRLQSRRLKLIEDTANKHLDAARLGGPGYRVKKEVLVPYEDLLKIWDVANKTRMDL